MPRIIVILAAALALILLAARHRPTPDTVTGNYLPLSRRPNTPTPPRGRGPWVTCAGYPFAITRAQLDSEMQLYQGADLAAAAQYRDALERTRQGGILRGGDSVYQEETTASGDVRLQLLKSSLTIWAPAEAIRAPCK